MLAGVCAAADDAGTPPKVAGDYQPSDCWDFSSPYGSFASPRYPLNYPNSTECLQTLIGQPPSLVSI